ncbi:hypothetical protein LYNGBM3L_34540 [Moorena producens 3L]|uniref:HlyD family secretion protein n=2 Tax=Coleofasciculaceae TaxID=1892251 RepID=F4XPN4_9CYAN|nr:hypothetical protein LYNGBM3L_34540 [Moorena producens 3L]OLT63959.1 hypothetical protein BI334_01980 [Moorena producens 3L]
MRKTHHYGLGEAARSWGFPPLAIAVVSPTRYCIKTMSNTLMGSAIFQLPIQRPGAVVQQGTMVAEIAPEDSSLIIRAQMATTESGYLKKGMPVKLKFDAYPFQ